MILTLTLVKWICISPDAISRPVDIILHCTYHHEPANGVASEVSQGIETLRIYDLVDRWSKVLKLGIGTGEEILSRHQGDPEVLEAVSLSDQTMLACGKGRWVETEQVGFKKRNRFLLALT